MKYIFIISILIGITSIVHAARYDITADIGQIRYHEASSTFAPAYQKHMWFGLVNTDQTPNCPKHNNEYIISIPDGNSSAVSMLLSAKMANKKILVTIDDVIKFPNGSHCLLQYLTIK